MLTRMCLENDGAITFQNDGGLCFGEIYAYDEDDELTITTAGIANKIQITTFEANGESNNTTPDYTNSHITITKAGIYKCNVSIHAESAAAGGADTFGFAVYKNNGATLFENCHAHRQLSGGGGDIGSIGISGLLNLAVDDTIEIWCWNDTSTDNIVIDDINLNLILIGSQEDNMELTKKDSNTLEFVTTELNEITREQLEKKKAHLLKQIKEVDEMVKILDKQKDL